MVLAVRRKLGEDTDDFWDETDIISELNMALRAFSREERWPWLQTIRTGDQLLLGEHTIALPADIDLVRAFGIVLQAGSEKPITPRKVNPSEGMKLRTERTSNGRPLYFYLASTAQSVTGPGNETLTTSIRFVPAADKTYDIEYLYYRRPATLSTDDQEPDIPEDYQDAIVSYATARLWEHELAGSQAKAAEQYAIYQRNVEAARRDMYKLADDESIVWGREQDEEEKFDWAGLPMLPDEYGRRYGWDA